MPFSRRMPSLTAAGAVLLLSAAAWPASSHTSPSDDTAPRHAAARELIVPNDNRTPAGTLRDGVLSLQLEVRNGEWYPEGRSGAAVPVYAFAEPGKSPTNPGPLVRVRTGTEIAMTVTNTLDKPLHMHGLGEERGVFGPPVVLAPGASHEFRFHAGDPGVYYYAGRTEPLPPDTPILLALGDDSQLNGAIVVDPADSPPAPADRILMISWWFILDSTSATGLSHGTMAINGLSWPHTERFDVMQGDTLHWRFVNMTITEHPMHLHGFYFRVDGHGDGTTHHTLPASERRLAVTELMHPGSTLDVTWAPTRPGNWVFHCHFAGHISHHVALDSRKGVPKQHVGHDAGASHQMSGLVLGINVRPTPGVILAGEAAARPIRLLVRSRPGTSGVTRQFAYVLGGSPQEYDRDSYPAPGPTLVLEQGEAVAVNIVNQSEEPAAVHWHGIELESFPDGVPGWSGSPGNILPSIGPGDSLTVRFTPPRAGTFMYHSHFNEFSQIMNGLYGPIVVLPPGVRRDAERDRVLMISDGAAWQNFLGAPPPIAVNGQVNPDTMLLRAGRTYRLRIANILTDFPASMTLLNGAAPATWRIVAKDGADLPPHQIKDGEARLVFGPGEIYDIEVTPRAGTMSLVMGIPAPPGAPANPATVVPMVVK
jgi:manganese oxidase